ncbi:hypothetical protein Z042_01225 [Chania multitudinisentens RB-25]|uniref:Uncharacterized protein n=2 Tax=Chania TaxID=1745211 RepID=W0LKP8_9GAMM|nr:hypothetical protein Z042_01225 [Chania multitudinisentens RB-25]
MSKARRSKRPETDEEREALISTLHQDIARSKARTLGGSFFLDKPVAHLDDLNRVAMMDIF